MRHGEEGKSKVIVGIRILGRFGREAEWMEIWNSDFSDYLFGVDFIYVFAFVWMHDIIL